MNLLHMRYALEVAQTGSINKAAERLFVGQPNLSRAIKELEASLGVTLFERSARGMLLTPDGEIFIRYAKGILSQVDQVEELFRGGSVARKRFSLSAPRAAYVTEALAQFTRSLPPDEDIEIFYKETNSRRTVKNVLQDNYRLGIIRYAAEYDRYYTTMLEEEQLHGERIAEFHYQLLLNADSPLAQKETITREDLKDCISIAHADPYVPFMPQAEVNQEELPVISRRNLYVFERSSPMELLSSTPDAFMWASPTPEALLRRYGLVQRPCDENRRLYKDVLIYPKDYSLSPLDEQFIRHLIQAKRRTIKE